MDRNLFEAMHSRTNELKKIAEANKEPTFLDKFLTNRYVKAALKTVLFIIAAVFCVLLVLYLMVGGMVFLMLNAIFNQFTSDEKRVQEELAIHLKSKYQEEFRIEKVEYNGTLDKYSAEVHSVAKPDYKIRVDVSEKNKQFVFKDDYVQAFWNAELKETVYPKLQELLPEEKYRINNVSDYHSLYGEFVDENAIIFGPKYISFQEAIDRQLFYLDVRYERLEDGTAVEDELKNVHKVVDLAKSFRINRMWIEQRSKQDRRELRCRINDVNSINSMAELEKVCE
ncbi:hypothetical protein SAMN04487970_1011103 [Paenibacillus tianmuensis]|uniref:Uncharacterized protein n=1 Tax=Paenibacillus tianmuensis TaxID=624147 RepID=A0A1G4R3N2_9BACL|nr:hypothetical protein [Paenibacillus tianmuensis]SCW51267.1 hypothetical protein SAMN04487970_1011103 [Paenibacillus tianmuensis]